MHKCIMDRLAEGREIIGFMDSEPALRGFQVRREDDEVGPAGTGCREFCVPPPALPWNHRWRTDIVADTNPTRFAEKVRQIAKGLAATSAYSSLAMTLAKIALAAETA